MLVQSLVLSLSLFLPFDYVSSFVGAERRSG